VRLVGGVAGAVVDAPREHPVQSLGGDVQPVAVEVRQHDGSRTALQQPLGDGFADAAGGARDDRRGSSDVCTAAHRCFLISAFARLAL
jgi:hypothetical protein